SGSWRSIDGEEKVARQKSKRPERARAVATPGISGLPAPPLLAGEAFLVVGAPGRAGLEDRGPLAPGMGGALHRLGAQVVERLAAALPRRPVQHVQVPLVDV